MRCNKTQKEQSRKTVTERQEILSNKTEEIKVQQRKRRIKVTGEQQSFSFGFESGDQQEVGSICEQHRS